MKRILCLLVPVALLCSGCVTIEAQSYYPEGQFPATDVKSVKIFRDIPPRPHTVIGEIYIENSDYMDDTDKDELKKKIAAIGGDAATPDCKEKMVPALETVELNKDYKDELSGKTTEYYPARIETSCSNSAYKIIRFDSVSK